jgi:hypothetical protein
MFAASVRSRAGLIAWIVLLAALAAAALGRVAFAQDPTADFTVTPAAPMEDQRATYSAVLSRDYRGAAVQWDFDADPLGVFEGRGATIRRTYATPGEKRVRMRVILKGEVKAVVTKTVVIAARPVEPVPEPTPVPPPAPVPPPPPPAVPIPPAPPADVTQIAPALMRPFPVVRIAGLLMPWGARVRLLTVRSPRGAIVTVRCRGEGCPLRSLRRRARKRLVHIQSLERRLPAGIRVEILVRKRNLIGKYTRIGIRSGVRPPLRLDRCLRPGRSEPVRCPSA